LRGEDALESALAMHIAATEGLPASSEAEAVQEMVPLSALGIAKTVLYEAMREHGVGRAKVARRLRWHPPQVNRVLDLRHGSRMEHVEAALAALGLRLIIDVAKRRDRFYRSVSMSICGDPSVRTSIGKERLPSAISDRSLLIAACSLSMST
jgi:antitoxin HicB